MARRARQSAIGAAIGVEAAILGGAVIVVAHGGVGVEGAGSGGGSGRAEEGPGEEGRGEEALHCKRRRHWN